MSEPVNPYSDKEIERRREWLRGLKAREPDKYPRFDSELVAARWLATVDAREARLAAVERELDEALALLRRCRSFVAAIRDSNAEDGRSGFGTALLGDVDALLRGGEVKS